MLRRWGVVGCGLFALSGALMAAAFDAGAIRPGAGDPQAAVIADIASERVSGAEAAPERHFLGGFLKDSRVVYPLRIGRWNAQDEKRFEDARFGASVRYRDPDRDDRWLDVYFYPAGVLPDGQLAIDMRATLDDLRALAGRADYYAQIDASDVEAFSIRVDGPRDTPKVPALSADLLQVRADGKPYHSAIVLLSHQLYYVKARYSVEADAMSRRKVRKQLEAFVTGLVRETDITSTGECWMPLPIEAVASASPVPEGAGTRMTDEVGGAAYVLPGRVLATDPDGPMASVVQMMGMIEQGRWFDGCVGADPVNPEVREGKRELRFEYRAPSPSDDNRKPSRGYRSGARSV